MWWAVFHSYLHIRPLIGREKKAGWHKALIPSNLAPLSLSVAQSNPQGRRCQVEWHEHNISCVISVIIGRYGLTTARFKAISGTHSLWESSPQCSGALVPGASRAAFPSREFLLVLSHTPIPRQCLKGSMQFWLLNLHCFSLQGQETIQKSGVGPTSGLQYMQYYFKGLVPGYIRSTGQSGFHQLTNQVGSPLTWLSTSGPLSLSTFTCRHKFILTSSPQLNTWQRKSSTDKSNLNDWRKWLFTDQQWPPLGGIIGQELVGSICTMVEKMPHQNNL